MCWPVLLKKMEHRLAVHAAEHGTANCRLALAAIRQVVAPETLLSSSCCLSSPDISSIRRLSECRLGLRTRTASKSSTSRSARTCEFYRQQERDCWTKPR